MDKSTFEAADKHVKRIAALVEKFANSPHLETLKQDLAALGKTVGTDYSINFQCVLDVYDSERKQGLPLLRTGLTSLGGEEPFRTWEDLTLQSYVALGEMRTVPNECCPICWGTWVSKLLQPVCSHCSALLGEDVKVLLDSDTCPNCLLGTVTSTELVCDQCLFEIDPNFVVWA